MNLNEYFKNAKLSLQKLKERKFRFFFKVKNYIDNKGLFLYKFTNSTFKTKLTNYLTGITHFEVCSTGVPSRDSYVGESNP